MHQPQQLERLFARSACIQAAMPAEGFDHLVADRIQRIERGHRLLEDHADLAPR
jgi:hypothetical protein